MITGVAAVVYQMLIHSKERSRINQIMANLGASKLQIMTQAFIENVLIVIVAALSGMFLSIGLGKLVCYLIGRSKGYQFLRLKAAYILMCLSCFWFCSSKYGGKLYR